MRPSVLLRLAFSGSLTDRVRVGLTIVAAMWAGLAILVVGTVVNMAPTEQDIVTPDGGVLTITAGWRYTTTLLNDSDMRPGLIAMATAMLIPALALIAQSARLGGPARDQRLAAMRLAGATPQQGRAIAAVEQGVTVGIGALLALIAYPILRAALHQPTMNGTRQSGVEGFDGMTISVEPYTGPLLPLPTDTWPSWWSWLTVALGLPIVAAVLSALALRGLVKSRSSRKVRPRLWPVALIAAGLADLALCRVWLEGLQAREAPPDELVAPYVVMVLGLAAICVGVPFCASGVAYLGAKVALRFGRKPSTLIAARRVLADPGSGSRATSALLVCTIMTVALVGIQANYDFINEVSMQYGTYHGDEKLNTLVMSILRGLALMFLIFAAVGLLIALVDTAMTRRYTEAALLASGTPGGVLVRSRLTAVLLTAVPGVLLGIVTGFAVPALALPPAQQPASITATCYGFSNADVQPVVPCTAENVALQHKFDRSYDGSGWPPYSYIRYETAGPWHNRYPPIPWLGLIAFGGVVLAAVAIATLLSLMIGRRASAATALRVS